MSHKAKFLLFLCIAIPILIWLFVKRQSLEKDISSSTNLTYDCVPSESGLNNCVSKNETCFFLKVVF